MKWPEHSFSGAAGAPLKLVLAGAMAVPALACADLDRIKSSAAMFSNRHPQVDPAGLTWGERLFDRSARDAYTMACLNSEAIEAIRQLGARPCIRCGDFTASWCEACPTPSPYALCSECDRAHFLCHSCVGEGKLWSLARSAPPADTMEIDGYMDTTNKHHHVNPLLHLKTAEVPKIDGVYDMAYITHGQRIMEYEEEMNQRPCCCCGWATQLTPLDWRLHHTHWGCPSQGSAQGQSQGLEGFSQAAAYNYHTGGYSQGLGAGCCQTTTYTYPSGASLRRPSTRSMRC